MRGLVQETTMSTSISFDQMAKLHRTLVDKGLSSRDVQEYLLGQGILSDIAVAIKRGSIPDRATFRDFLRLNPDMFGILVDYRKSFSDLVEAGQYDFVDNEILGESIRWKSGNETVPVQVELYHFRNIQNFHQAHREGYRSANTQELLHFGAMYPEIQKERISVVIVDPTDEKADGQNIHFALDFVGGRRRFVRYDEDGVLPFMSSIDIKQCYFLLVKQG